MIVNKLTTVNNLNLIKSVTSFIILSFCHNNVFFLQRYENILVLRHPIEEDSGVYEIVASTASRTSRFSFKLLVEGIIISNSKMYEVPTMIRKPKSKAAIYMSFYEKFKYLFMSWSAMYPELPQSVLAPVMWPQRDSMEVSLHSTFRLTCRGQAELSWYSPVYLHDQFDTEKKGLFISTVTVGNATAAYTGKYICYYDSSNSTEETAIYIYVPGTDLFFLHKPDWQSNVVKKKYTIKLVWSPLYMANWYWISCQKLTQIQKRRLCRPWTLLKTMCWRVMMKWRFPAVWRTPVPASLWFTLRPIRFCPVSMTAREDSLASSVLGRMSAGPSLMDRHMTALSTSFTAGQVRMNLIVWMAGDNAEMIVFVSTLLYFTVKK